MKHLLNNLSEEEKNSIREQHTGGMKVMTEKFSKLLNTKSGDVKPLVENVINEEISAEEIQKLGLIAKNLSRKYSNEISNQKGKMGVGNILLNKQMDQEVLEFQKLFNSMISKAERGNVFFGLPKLKEDGFIGNKTIEAMTMAENRLRDSRRFEEQDDPDVTGGSTTSTNKTATSGTSKPTGSKPNPTTRVGMTKAMTSSRRF